MGGRVWREPAPASCGQPVSPTRPKRSRLVGDDDGAPKLVGQALERTQEPPQVHLAGGQLAPAVELGAVQRCDRVDDD